MQLLLWYKGLDEAGVAQAMVERLQACGFVVAGAGANPWESVRLGATKIFCSVTARFEAHVCVDLYLRPKGAAGIPCAASSFLGVFESAIADSTWPVREASLSLGPGIEVPFFSLQRFRPFLPPALILGAVEGEWRELRPGQPGYWREAGATLYFIASQVLAEQGVPTPEAWTRAVGGALIPRENGVLLDCGWSAWWRENVTSDG